MAKVTSWTAPRSVWRWARLFWLLQEHGELPGGGDDELDDLF